MSRTAAGWGGGGGGDFLAGKSWSGQIVHGPGQVLSSLLCTLCHAALGTAR